MNRIFLKNEKKNKSTVKIVHKDVMLVYSKHISIGLEFDVLGYHIYIYIYIYIETFKYPQLAHCIYKKFHRQIGTSDY